MYAFATKIRCPHCSFSRHWKLRRNKYKCKRCRCEWAASVLLEGIRATRTEWKKCIEAFLEYRTIHAVAERTGIGFGRAVRMLNLIRTKMSDDTPGPFPGIIEGDETFIGGQWKNKPRHIRRRGTKKGHGTCKTPIVGLYSRRLRQVAIQVVERRCEETVIGFMCSRVKKGAILYTDGYKMNRAVTKYGVRHYYVNHHLGEFVRGSIHTNGIEGFWGYLKKHLAMIGGIRKDRLPLFAGEIAWRFNHRTLTAEQRRDRLLRLLFQ